MSGHEKHTRIAVLTIFLAMVVTILAGCKSPEPNPELRDPIYSDLSAQAGAYKGKVESQQKKLEDLTAELEKMTTRDPNRKRAIKDKYDLERGLVQLKQAQQYFEIRSEQRKAYDAEAYMKAFNADKPWPDPQELVDYREFQKLRNAPRSWDSHVPKMTKYTRKDPNLAPTKKEAKAAEKTAGKSEGGEAKAEKE